MARTSWRIQPPGYTSDYQDTFINGSGQHPFGLPGLSCSVCKETYGSIHIVPYECPEKLRGREELQQGWPISERKHMALQQEVLSELWASGTLVKSLPTIYDFQPLHLKFGSRPESDFLWSTLGSVVVSARVKALFEQQSISGVVFGPAVTDKVGKRRSKGPVLIPSTGEPEDVVEEAEPERYPEGFGPLYEMIIITARSDRPPGAEVASRCPVCGREEYDDSKRQVVLTEAMVPDADIFFLDTTLYMIVTERVRDLVMRHRLTNVDFGWYDVVA